MLVLHEYNECYMYYSYMESETDNKTRAVWEQLLDDEIAHLRIACDLMKQYEKRDASDFLPDELPELTIFQSNKDYVRDVLARQVDWTAKGTEFVETSSLPGDYRYFAFQDIVNGDSVPSQDVIAEHIRKQGHDYSLETEGPHPVERMRRHEVVVT